MWTIKLLYKKIPSSDASNSIFLHLDAGSTEVFILENPQFTLMAHAVLCIYVVSQNYLKTTTTTTNLQDVAILIFIIHLHWRLKLDFLDPVSLYFPI